MTGRYIKRRNGCGSYASHWRHSQKSFWPVLMFIVCPLFDVLFIVRIAWWVMNQANITSSSCGLSDDVASPVSMLIACRFCAKWWAVVRLIPSGDQAHSPEPRCNAVDLMGVFPNGSHLPRGLDCGQWMDQHVHCGQRTWWNKWYGCCLSVATGQYVVLPCYM